MFKSVLNYYPLNTLVQKRTLSPELKSYLILAFLSLIWGSSFILIKKGLVAYSPVQLGYLRLGISAISFLPLLLYRLPKVDWSRWKFLLVVGICGSGLPSILFAIAQTQVSSSVAGILNSLTPLFTLFLGFLIFGSALLWSKIAGVLLGLAGASLLILLGAGSGDGGNAWYALFVVAATICYAISGNTVGKYLRDMDSLVIAAVSFSMVGLPALILLFTTTDFVQVIQNADQAWPALGYISILAIAGTVLASIVFFRLVQLTSPVFASTVAYLIPIVALLWGALDGEQITAVHFAAMGMILFGVYLSRK